MRGLRVPTRRGPRTACRGKTVPRADRRRGVYGPGRPREGRIGPAPGDGSPSFRPPRPAARHCLPRRGPVARNARGMRRGRAGVPVAGVERGADERTKGRRAPGADAHWPRCRAGAEVPTSTRQPVRDRRPGSMAAGRDGCGLLGAVEDAPDGPARAPPSKRPETPLSSWRSLTSRPGGRPGPPSSATARSPCSRSWQTTGRRRTSAAGPPF